MNDLANDLAILQAPRPKTKGKAKRKAKRIPRIKIIKAQLKEIVNLLIFWRDANECVQQKDDGVRCGGGLVWGHYVAQGQSKWLKYDLSNVFVQCDNHNLLDYRGDKSYSAWFVSKFGERAAKALDDVRAARTNGKDRTIQELEDLLAYYKDLYDQRFFVQTDLKSLVEAGYYGQIIKSTFEERGKGNGK